MIGFRKLATAAVELRVSGAAWAETTNRVQSVIPAKADEVFMLEEFAKDVSDLTGGSLKIEVLPAGAVVGVRETLDAVDAGGFEVGFAWSHYWSGKHPAAMRFGSPVALASTTSPVCPGSSTAAAKSSMTSFGTKWA